MSNRTFDFSEALRRMKEGKKVRRKSWSNCYSFIDDKRIYVRCKQYNDLRHRVEHLDVQFTSFPCVDDDILATDWEEVEG